MFRFFTPAFALLALSSAAFAQQAAPELLGGPFDAPLERTTSASARQIQPALADPAPTPIVITEPVPLFPVVLEPLSNRPVETPPQPQASFFPERMAPMLRAPPAPTQHPPAQVTGPRATPTHRAAPVAHTPSPIINPISGPAASTRIGMGYNLCLDAQGGLRDLNEARVPALILWPCDGLDNQIAVLASGALMFSPTLRHVVRPAKAPLSGCEEHEAASVRRAYVFRVCAGEGGFAVDASNPQRVVITSFAPPGRSAYTRGAPLFVDRLNAGETGASWELVERGHLIALGGAELCITAPSQDVSQNAPLYLDFCVAPFQLDAANRSDGAQRSRATFVIDWR